MSYPITTATLYPFYQGGESVTRVASPGSPVDLMADKDLAIVSVDTVAVVRTVNAATGEITAYGYRANGDLDWKLIRRFRS